jgi:putative ABC transport system permease protein
MVFVTLQGFDEIHESRMPPPEDPFDVEAEGPDLVDAEQSVPSGDLKDLHKDDRADHVHADHEHDEGALDDQEDHGNQEKNDNSEHSDQGVVPVDTHLDDHAAQEAHKDEHGHSEEHNGHHHEPETINAVLVGLSDRTAVLGIQRTLSELRSDPVSAVMPAVALAELWGITSTAENVMRVMAWAVALAGLIGMLVMLSATLDTRRREFAILRSVGATPSRIFGLIISEAALLTGAGLVFGTVVLTLATLIANPVLSTQFGVSLDLGGFGPQELTVMGMIFCAGLVAATVPALRVYRMTLADGLSIRI